MSLNYLITGGAGFIGSNYASRLIMRGERVTILDNFSRRGSRINAKWLQETYGSNSFQIVEGDIRDTELLERVSANASVIVHLAAQVAVTTSVTNPRNDFEVNALGTFNVLEAARLSGNHPVILYASTNKVYGGMEDQQVILQDSRYSYADSIYGIPETQPLNFHSPYGCSKGTGDQYVRDYHRIYGLPTVVLRQSCIYGPRQFGIEDQGWVAWFIIAAVMGSSITIYGDGKQARDLLFIDDLIDAYESAISHIDRAAGQVYNIGGGAENVMSVWNDFGPKLWELLGHAMHVERADWRPGDQKIYVSDIRKAIRDLGWKPKVTVDVGIRKLYDWVSQNKPLFSPR